MILRAAAVVVLTMLPAAVMAQDGPTQADFAAASAAGDRLDSGRYLDATEALRPLAFDAAGKPKPGFLYDQWAELRTLMTAEPVEPEPVPAQTAEARAMEDRVAAASLRDAIPEIVARAAQTRVVILNENHGLPRDRAFALEVARALRPLGYSVLAAETFMGGDKGVAMSKLAKQGYPTQGTGYYTHDPVFGDFVRQSLALGYRPLSYEQAEEERGEPAGRAESIARREEAQANHLARALAASPDAKVFIYVGFSHVAERPIKGSDGDAPISWMAARLKAKTGIDPLTIDQVTLGPGAGRDTGLARRALAAKGLQRSTVLLKGDRPVTVGQYADAVDLQVYHPATRMVKGRPDWLAAMGRKPMAIPAGFVPQKGERLVQAFIAGESDDAIPVDQVLLRAGEDVPALLVPGDKPLRLVMQDPTPSPNGLRAKP